MAHCVSLIAFHATFANEFPRATPMNAWSMKLFLTSGELSIAVTPRSMRSMNDHMTEPVELALNWMPWGGDTAIVLFRRNRISLPGKPFASSRPSTYRARPALNRTMVPGMIRSVTPGRTVTCPTRMYGVPVRSHTVSEVMAPPTYVNAAACGDVNRRAVRDPVTRTRTVAMLRHRGLRRGDAMRGGLPKEGSGVRSLRPGSCGTIY